jgi:hypothetical protein
MGALRGGARRSEYRTDLRSGKQQIKVQCLQLVSVNYFLFQKSKVAQQKGQGTNPWPFASPFPLHRTSLVTTELKSGQTPVIKLICPQAWCLFMYDYAAATKTSAR